MIKKPHSAIGLGTKLLKGILPELPRHAEGHDEWLLDEALAETFPASDPIAVTPIHLLGGSSSRKSREIEWPSKVSDCDNGQGKEPDFKALETPIECDNCETSRIEFLLQRDGAAATRIWVRCTLAIYLRSVLNRRHFAHTNEYRRKFVASCLSFRSWLASNGGYGGC